jgi:hypothetical protein
MSRYGDAYGGDSTYGFEFNSAWPAFEVRIGTSLGANSFVLDDVQRGVLDGIYTLSDSLGFVWTNITPDIRDSSGINVSRGSTRNQGPYYRYEAGTCTFTLENRTGRYDPLNLSGPFVVSNVTLLRPSMPVSVRIEYDDVWHDLFTGYVESWNVQYSNNGNDSVAVVSCVDAAGTLSQTDPLEAPAQGSGESASARITRILDNVKWPAEQRSIAVDTSSFLPTTLAQPAWTEMLLTADSVNGYLWVNASGDVVFQTKQSFERNASFSFGPTAGDIPIADIQASGDAEQVINTLKLAREEGIQLAAFNEESIGLYGQRAYQRNDLQVSSDTLVQESIDYIISQYADLEFRVEGFNVYPQPEWSSDLWNKVLNLELLRHVKVLFSTPDGRTVEVSNLIRGIKTSIKSGQWSMSISTAQVPDRGGDFTLDDPELGPLSYFTEVEREVLLSWYHGMLGRFGEATARGYLLNGYLFHDSVYGWTSWNTYWGAVEAGWTFVMPITPGYAFVFADQISGVDEIATLLKMWAWFVDQSVAWASLQVTPEKLEAWDDYYAYERLALF